MLALKTGAERHAARHRPGARRRVPARAQQRAGGLRAARLRPPAAGDERPLERVLRVHEGRRLEGPALLDGGVPAGVRAHRPPRARRPGGRAQPEAAQARRALRSAATSRGRRRASSGTRRATERRTSRRTRLAPTTRETGTSTSSRTISTTRGSRLRGRRTTRLYAAHPGKPYAIGEWGLWGIDDPAYVERMAAFVRTHGRIEFISYFNSKPGSLWDLASKPRSRAAYRRVITPLGG